MDLYIYLVVALKKAMNLQCLERIASIHFLSPYLVSFHFWLGVGYLECHHQSPHLACCLPLDCCYGLLDVVLDFPLKREKIQLLLSSR